MTVLTDRIGSTHLGPVQATTLAFGGAPLGGLYEAVPDSEVEGLMTDAWDAGIRYFDTAPLYGSGASERRIGAFLRGKPREQFTVSTKVGRLLQPGPAPSGTAESMYVGADDLVPVFDFSADAIRRSLDSSLSRLGLDRVDVVYLHDPDDHWRPALEQAYPVLHELRAQGVVGAIGVGMNQSAMPTRFVRETDIDVVLLAGRWTLLDRSAGNDLLPACAERGVSIVAGGVLNSGILADPRPGARYDYEPASADLVTRAQAMARTFAEHGTSLLAAALQFPLRAPEVRSVLVGVRSRAELAANVAAFTAPVPDQLWNELDDANGPTGAGAGTSATDGTSA